MSDLKPIDDSTVIYARPNGGHYHLDINCIMLLDSGFEILGYVEIKKADIKKRKLYPCACAFEGRRKR